MDSDELVDSIHKETGRDYFEFEIARHILRHTGSRELIDTVCLPLVSLYICVMILFIVGVLSYSLKSYRLLYLGLFVCGVIIYFTFLIYLRMKIFYFGGSKAECEKRCPGSYPRVSYIWSFFSYIQTIMFSLLYLATKIQSFIFGIIVTLILAHIFIFPDYLNKVLPYEFRSVEGNFDKNRYILSSVILATYFLIGASLM